jgi:hypothetical protein
MYRLFRAGYWLLVAWGVLVIAGIVTVGLAIWIDVIAQLPR